MTKMLQIRNVPDDVHRLLKARAAMAGMSMSHFVLREIERIVRRPSREDVLAAIRAAPPVTLAKEPAEIVRQARTEREQRVAEWSSTRPQQ